MHIILRKDIRQLIMNAETVQKDMEMLEQDHSIRTRKLEQNNLRQLIEHIKNLEFNMTTMLSDCVSLGRQYWKGHNLPLIHSLRRSNAIMNSVFKDLKRIRRALGGARINPSELRKMVMDWGRFKRSIYGIQKSVKYTRGRRKNHAWARKRSMEL